MIVPEASASPASADMMPPVQTPAANRINDFTSKASALERVMPYRYVDEVFWGTPACRGPRALLLA